MENLENGEVVGAGVGAVEGAAVVAAPKVKKARVELAEFITAWEGSSSVAEAAAKTGLKETSCQARASKYRSEGIPLKEMQRGGGARLEVASAQELLAKLRGVSVDVVTNAAKDAEVKRAERKAERDAAAAPSA